MAYLSMGINLNEIKRYFSKKLSLNYVFVLLYFGFYIMTPDSVFQFPLRAHVTDFFDTSLWEIYCHVTSSFLVSSELFHVT